jgi:hypothetical protein
MQPIIISLMSIFGGFFSWVETTPVSLLPKKHPIEVPPTSPKKMESNVNTANLGMSWMETDPPTVVGPAVFGDPADGTTPIEVTDPVGWAPPLTDGMAIVPAPPPFFSVVVSLVTVSLGLSWLEATYTTRKITETAETNTPTLISRRPTCYPA